MADAPTHIAINARFLSQPVTGVQRFAQEVVSSLDALLAAGDEAVKPFSFTLLAPPGPLAPLPLKHIPVRQVGRLSGHAWEQLELPRHLAGRPLLSLCNTGPLAVKRQLVVFHDAAVFAMPETFSYPFRTWYQFLLPTLGRRVEKVVTVSSFSKRELTRYCDLPEKAVGVVAEGFEHVLRAVPDRRVLAKHGLEHRPYVLAVSSVNPSKNFAALLAASALLDTSKFDIVIVGGVNSKVFGTPDLTIPNGVKRLGYVSEAELRAFYEGASCFVYPSLYEGFGIPPLEAMACGCPVIASNATSLPEVCGDAALYCDPHNPQDIADKIQRLMSYSDLREALRQKGAERIGQFSWDKCARSLLGYLAAGFNGKMP